MVNRSRVAKDREMIDSSGSSSSEEEDDDSDDRYDKEIYAVLHIRRVAEMERKKQEQNKKLKKYFLGNEESPVENSARN